MALYASSVLKYGGFECLTSHQKPSPFLPHNGHHGHSKLPTYRMNVITRIYITPQAVSSPVVHFMLRDRAFEYQYITHIWSIHRLPNMYMYAA